MKKLDQQKIFFMGTPPFAAHLLAHLRNHAIPIHTVITQPDRPFGRRKELVPSAVKKYALQYNIPVQQFETLDQSAMEFFLNETPDLIIVVAYGLILPKTLINLPAYGCINVHGSLLPELRGPSPIQTALLHGLKETGTTIMLMDEKMDNGDMLSQEKVSIDQQETYNTLEHKLLAASQSILIPTLQQWISHQLKPQKQAPEKATYTKIISKQDGRIVWANPALDIYHQYQAYYRWPKIHTYWNQSAAEADSPAPKEELVTPDFHKPVLKKITFHDIGIRQQDDLHKMKIGQVFMTSDNLLAIQTGSGLILPHSLQLEGKNPVLPKEFINGYPQFLGITLE